MKWPFRKRRVDPDAMAAVADAERSHQQAGDDLARLRPKASETHRVASRVREHNDANHYDDWLARYIARRT